MEKPVEPVGATGYYFIGIVSLKQQFISLPILRFQMPIAYNPLENLAPDNFVIVLKSHKLSSLLKTAQPLLWLRISAQ